MKCELTDIKTIINMLIEGIAVWDSELNDTKNLIHHLQMQLKYIEKKLVLKS